MVAPSESVVRTPHEKELLFSAKLLGAEFTLCDSAGDIVRGSVEKVTTRVEAYTNLVSMETR